MPVIEKLTKPKHIHFKCTHISVFNIMNVCAMMTWFVISIIFTHFTYFSHGKLWVYDTKIILCCHTKMTTDEIMDVIKIY